MAHTGGEAYFSQPEAGVYFIPCRQPSIKICQVPGCTECLGRAYNLKRRLCDTHMRAVAVLRSGHGDKLWRFCQQHARLELLQCFEGCRRSCKMSLLKKRAHACGKAPAAQPQKRATRPQKKQQRRAAAPAGCTSAPQSPCWWALCEQQQQQPTMTMELYASPSVSAAAPATATESPCSSQPCSTSCWTPTSSEGAGAEAAPSPHSWSAISKDVMVAQLTDFIFQADDDDDDEDSTTHECTGLLVDTLTQQLLAEGAPGSPLAGSPGADLQAAQLPMFASPHEAPWQPESPSSETLESFIGSALLEAAGAALAPHAVPAAAAHSSAFAASIPAPFLPVTAGVTNYCRQVAQLKQQCAQLDNAMQSLRSLFSLDASCPGHQSAACGMLLC